MGAEWDGRVATQTISPLIAIKDPKEHLRRRKPWNRALSIASVKDFAPFVSHRTDQLVNALPEQPGPTNLAQWSGEGTVVYKPPEPFTDVWAPELHRINNEFYIYVAMAQNGDNASHRMYVLQGTSNTDPTQPFNVRIPS